MKNLTRALGAISLLVASGAFGAISIGNGGAISLGNGALDLSGRNLTVNGRFDVANGTVSEAGDILINGAFDGGTGSVFLRGDWTNNGVFDAGLGQVSFLDDLGGSAQISGASTFYGLSLVSSAGGAFVLQSGTIQRVIDNLIVRGVSGLPVQIESSIELSIAELLLEPGGSQDIAFVGVSDVHATGESLAPDETNQGGRGNDRGWFGVPINPAPLVIPTLSLPGVLILILALFGLAYARRRGVA